MDEWKKEQELMPTKSCIGIRCALLIALLFELGVPAFAFKEVHEGFIEMPQRFPKQGQRGRFTPFQELLPQLFGARGSTGPGTGSTGGTGTGSKGGTGIGWGAGTGTGCGFGTGTGSTGGVGTG